MYVSPSPTFARHKGRLAELGVKHRLPAIYEVRNYVEAGGLMSYGPSFLDVYRRAAGYVDRIFKGADLVRLKVDLIVTRGSIFVQGARKATSSIPIVFTMHADPEGTGHVASLARPGGSITGLSLLQTEINRKGFEILISTVPAAKRIAVLYNPAKAMTDAEATAAILAHLERMDRADVILVFNQDGYVGNSVAMEIGYAYSRRKPLYALQPIPDQFLMGLLSGVVSPKKFIELTCSASSTPVDPRRPKGK